jgi:serine/threonine protein kinase
MSDILTAQSIDAKPKRLGEFEVLGKIDRGGIAEIYLGRQQSLDRMVAIKILSAAYSTNPEVVKRFEIESKTIARLRHPHIVHVIDRGIENGQYYFVMEMVEGITFKKMLSDKSVPLSRKFTTIIQVLKALDYAHKNGVIHRDIKPANILIDKSGNALMVDFGIAQIIDKDEMEKTQPDAIMGTLHYMSPEQKMGSADIDHTTDIYAVGVILYEMLTGQKPLGRFKNPCELNSDVPPELDSIVMRCLENNKKDRFQSAVALKDQILSVLHKHSGNDNGQKELSGDLKDYIGRLSHLDTLNKTKNISTHLVEDRNGGEIFVLKSISGSDAGLKEAKILKILRHEGFIDIYAADGNSHKIIILMAYSRGGSLEDRLLREYPPRVALQIFKKIMAALEHAHKNNLVHANLRPSNILFDEAENVILTDFGQSANHRNENLNRYAAPERRKGKLADIYSAGVILHRLLTNHLPVFDSYLRLIWQDSYPKVPTSLKMLIMHMLRNGLQERPQSVEEVMVRLEESEKEMPSSADDSDRKSTLTLKKGFRPAMLIILLLIALVALSLLIFGDSFFEPFFALTS